jgi:hypothetical protein
LVETCLKTDANGNSGSSGKVFAAIQPIYTPVRVAQFISGLARMFVSGESEPSVYLVNITDNDSRGACHEAAPLFLLNKRAD